MARRIVVGIDIGTYQIKVVVSASAPDDAPPTVIGTGYALSRGIRHGYIMNTTDTTRSLKQALAQAEKASGVAIRKAYLSVGGVGLEELRARAEVLTTRADQEVTQLDTSRALEACEQKVKHRLANRKVMHVVPLAYRLDGERVLGRPIGLKGSKLEVETLFVTTLEQHLQDLITAVEDAGVAVIDVMASPLAGSFVTVNKAQKIAGCVLANIGAETVSIAVFENDVPISVKVFPIGSTDITHDIALGLKIGLDDAEQAKKGALVGDVPNKKHLDDIIASRLSDIFDLIEAHLKRIGKNGLLPAGIILTGGGSGVATIEDIARASLKLPSKRAQLLGDPSKIKDASWAVAYGLTIWGMSSEETSGALTTVKDSFGGFFNWFRQFLP